MRSRPCGLPCWTPPGPTRPPYRARAEHEARDILDEATDRAEKILGEAHARGQADAAARRDEERARAHRRARGLELAARGEAFDALRARVADVLRERCTGPGRDAGHRAPARRRPRPPRRGGHAADARRGWRPRRRAGPVRRRLLRRARRTRRRSARATGGAAVAQVNSPQITRVNGPLVEIAHPASAAMGDMVTLGPDEVPAEIVALRDGQATAQAYEYTGGLMPGDPVAPQGHQLAARLGPALLGGVFDGLLRPLATAEVFLSGAAGRADGPPRRLRFTPRVRPGDHVRAGDVIGVLEPAAVEYRVLVPPDVAGVVEPSRQPGATPMTTSSSAYPARPSAPRSCGRCGGPDPSGAARPRSRRSRPDSACSICSSRCPAGEPPRCRAGSAPARRCCCSRSRSGVPPT